MKNEPPLIFESYLGMLRPASKAGEDAMKEIKGKVKITIKGGAANQKRRALYWVVADLVTPLLNDMHNMTLSVLDLHDITRDKLKLVEEITLPSGEVHKRRRSTSNRAMNEHDRAEYTNRAFALWSTWTGVDVQTLREEAEANG